MNKHFTDRHHRMIKDAAAHVIAAADDSSTSLVDVISEMERYIVHETKVGDAAKIDLPQGRRGYTLRDGRLVELSSPVA